MRRRALLLAVIFIVVSFLANAVTVTAKDSQYTSSFPSVVCPPHQSGEVSFISLHSSKTPVRVTGTSSMNYKSSHSRRLSGGNQAVVVDAQKVTPISWVADQGVWASAITCIAPISSQWFVGGSADVTSKGIFTLVNSGLGRASVSLVIFTEKGRQPEQLVTLNANSVKSIPLVNLAPSATKIAIQVVPQTGRVNAFLSDSRGRGLRALGGDFVNGQGESAKNIVIPAIPHAVIRKDALPHTLRILVPGDVAAHINATIVSTDGTFAPAGIDGATIPAGRTIEIPIKTMMAPGKFALKLNSDRPIVASVFSKTVSLNKSDFIWSTPAPALTSSTYAVSGLTPTLVFTGSKFKVGLDLMALNGKIRHYDVTGESIASFAIPDGTREVSIVSTSREVYGALLNASHSGYGYAPLVQGSQLTRTTVPHANIRVLIP